MNLPVKNIVSEVDLKPSDALLPLFECIVNAIISLKQTKDMLFNDKKIQIQITRGDLPQNPDFDKICTIKSINVIDNGEGFTNANLKAYKTAYTHENKEFGGKGIGRFTILAGFKEIIISSNYKQNKKWYYRKLSFDPINEVKVIEEKESDYPERETTVELVDLYNKEIRDYTALSIDKIAETLMHHFLVYYLCKDLPIIEIKESDTNKSVIVNDLYKTLSTEREREFYIGDYKFEYYITKTVKTTNRKNHYVHYCANSRVVGDGRNIGKVNSIFSYPIVNNGIAYFLDVYVVSEYLNKKVYHSRNGFTIPLEKESELFFDKNNISFQEIEEKISDILVNKYNSFVKESQDRYIKEVKQYIETSAPRYRRFLNRRDVLNRIPPNLSDDKKEEYLYKISFTERKNIDEKIQKIIDKCDITEETIDEIKKELIEKTAYDSDSLSDYMMRRKAIIDIFKRFLEADMTGKYKLEKDIHNLIFPMGITQRDIDYETHNLWLLDERFAIYSFIASDKPITTFSQNKSTKEPDLIMIEKPPMFENPICFAPEQAGEISSMVIFEFKRPGEVSHNKGKTDFRWEFSELIEKYFDDFLYGQNKKNYRGAQVDVRPETPKYGYVIVDVIPERLEKYNKGKGYRKTPFGTFYKIYPDLNLHIEVIKFQQLIDAVQKRHTPFFDKLFKN